MVQQTNGRIIKLVKTDDAGPTFQGKKLKNQKVNVHYDYKIEMSDKYGKPKVRGFKSAVYIENLTNYFPLRLIALFLVYFQANN